MYYAYVLKSRKNDRFYTGSSADVLRRLSEHNAGKSQYDKLNMPFVLLYKEAFKTRGEAVHRERYLKTGAGRDEIKRIMGL